MGHPCDSCSCSMKLHTLRSLSRHLVHWKYLVATSSLSFILSTSIICIVFFHVPDLSNPFVDFVAIGTSLSARTQQFQALLTETSSSPEYFTKSNLTWNKEFGSNSAEVENHAFNFHKTAIDRFRRNKNVDYFEREYCLQETANEMTKPVNSLWSIYAKYSRVVFSINYNQIIEIPHKSLFMKNLTNSKKNLTYFSEPSLLYIILFDLCKLKLRITHLSTYQELCYRKSSKLYNNTHLLTVDNKIIIDRTKHNSCCSIWCLPSMIASIFNKQSCEQLEYIDAKQASELISTCYPAFLSGHLRRSCWDNYGTDPGLLCPLVYPSQCLYSPLLPIILAALLPNDSNNFNNWGKSLMVLPIHATGSHLFFNEIENEYKSGRLTEGLHIPFHFDGIYIQEYDEIVTQLLYRDTSWLFISLICLLILLTIWTRTIFIPILTVLAIIWSLLTAYTVYTIVLKIPHFPVINLLAIVLVTGLGADDLLVFYQIWKQKRFMLAQTTVIEHVDHDNNLNTTPNFKTQELISTDQNNLLSISSSLNNRTNIISNKCFNTDEIHSISMNHLQNDQLTNEQQLTECLYYTLLHAIPSMTLTTISTICGLLVNLFSSIIAIKRFTIFASFVIIFNYIFIILMIIPMIIIFELNYFSLYKNFMNLLFYKYYQSFIKLINQLILLFNKLIIKFNLIFPFIIIITLLFTCYQLLWLRKFNIPSNHYHSSTFLPINHPLEQFTHKYINHSFWTESNLHYYQNLLKINFIWGPKPYDERNIFNYNDDIYIHSKLLLYSSNMINFTSIHSRLWLLKFCNELKRMPFLFQSFPIKYQQTLNSLELSLLNPLINIPVWCPFGRYINSIDNYIFSLNCSMDNSTCCYHGKPLQIYNSSVLSFISCLNEYISYENQYGYMTGFRFIHKSDINEPVGLIINALTNISLISSSHYDIEKFMNKITIWFNNLLLTAPNLLNHGFLVVNELEKFEITLNITQYIYPSVMIAVIIASLLIFLISKNILLSLLSLICLTCCLLSSITLLTCIDNWKLGIIEGLVISLAAGLAIDPCIHLAYAVSDKCNTGGWRCQQSVCSRNNLLIVLNSLGPAISGSAWTSAITGLPMLFSNLLCFHQIGAFLLTLMFCSWFFCYIVLTGILAFADQVFGYFKSNRVYL
uniref:SSD domain-containing protein n=1 Tax=Schistosoma mansoni TaxID=6183 RepID=A0A5K4FCP4_SCHMA